LGKSEAVKFKTNIEISMIISSGCTITRIKHIKQRLSRDKNCKGEGMGTRFCIKLLRLIIPDLLLICCVTISNLLKFGPSGPCFLYRWNGNTYLSPRLVKKIPCGSLVKCLSKCSLKSSHYSFLGVGWEEEKSPATIPDVKRRKPKSVACISI
jgi:hypothetical protein